MPPREAYDRLWSAFPRLFGYWGVLYSTNVACFVASDPTLWEYPIIQSMAFQGGTFILLVAIVTPANVSRAHAFLGSFQVSEQAQSAAGVAAIIGQIEPRKAVQMAKQSFTGISFSTLLLEHFESNSDSGLNAHALPAQFGEVDAFLSHSWSDPADAKWTALAAWANAFIGKHQRSPVLWLDKACLNQSEIATSLACLPIFLAGCKQLLIIAGPTYVTRIWCILEIFTFLKMGGSPDRVTVEVISSNSEIGLSREGVWSQMLEQFDVQQATCYHVNDRRKLLTAIESGFGSFDTFNSLVSNMLKDRSKGPHESSSHADAHGSHVGYNELERDDDCTA